LGCVCGNTENPCSSKPRQSNNVLPAQRVLRRFRTERRTYQQTWILQLLLVQSYSSLDVTECPASVNSSVTLPAPRPSSLSKEEKVINASSINHLDVTTSTNTSLVPPYGLTTSLITPTLDSRSEPSLHHLLPLQHHFSFLSRPSSILGKSKGCKSQITPQTRRFQ
jgi:hypothetical protein